MDTDALVSAQVEEGRKLLLGLADAGLEVTVAAWVQRAEDGQWALVIALPLIDRQGFAAGVSEVLRVFRAREHPWIASDDLSLVGAAHPRAAELLRIREHVSGRLFGRFKPSSLAGLPVREVYVYPERLGTQLTDAHKELLAALYSQLPLTVDALPYTEEMEQLHHEFVQQTGVAVSIGELFRALLKLRRQSRLVRKPDADAAIAADSPRAEPV